MLGIIDKTEYEIMINTINSFYEGWWEGFKHDEAIRKVKNSELLIDKAYV